MPASAELYATPAVPLGRLVVLIVRGEQLVQAEIIMARAAVAVCPAASETCTTILYVPAEVGVPDTVPVGIVNAMDGGNSPEARFQV